MPKPRRLPVTHLAAILTVSLGSLALAAVARPVSSPSSAAETTTTKALSAPGTYHLHVPANVLWYSTGLTIGAGDVLTITASGQWSYAPGKWVGPQGQPMDCPGDTDASQPPVYNAAADSLVARVSTNPLGQEVGAGITWKVTAAPGLLEMSMNDCNERFTDNTGSLSVTVTITTIWVTVNGFLVLNANDPYSVAERQMALRLPGTVEWPSSSAPLCGLQPSAILQSAGKTATSIVWTIAPSQAFLNETPASRLASATRISNRILGLLGQTYTSYMSQLKQDRLPPKGADLAQGWAIEVESVSTTGETMAFQASLASPTSSPVEKWNGLPTMPPGQGVQAPEALAVLLFYSKAVMGTGTTPAASSTSTTPTASSTNATPTASSTNATTTTTSSG